MNRIIHNSPRAILLLAAGLLLGGPVQAGSLFRQVYTGLDYAGIPGFAIINMTTNACFPDSPDPVFSSELIQDTFDYPVNLLDNYGDQTEGLLTAPQTGTYVFSIASDDDGELWLSTDATPANKVLIASVTGYTGHYEWGKYASQKSAPVSLVQGQSYYLLVRHKDGASGDNVAIGWQKPDGFLEQPMPTCYYEPYVATNTAVLITLDPVSIGVEDGRMVTFAVNLAPAAQPFTYQWYEDGIVIPGATLPGLQFRASMAKNNKKYSVQVGTVTSAEATLSVADDNTPPTVVDADTMGYDSVVRLTLSEPVTPASATNIAHYGISGGVTVQRATLSQAGTVIYLFTSHFNPQSAYTLTISGLADYATTPNLLNTSLQIGSAPGHITRKYFLNITGAAVADLTNSPAFPVQYDVVDSTNLFEGRVNWADNYGALLQGWLIPDTTGDYTLAISSDDNSALFLSTDATPANKRPTPIATVTGYTASRVYNGAANQQTTTPIHLVAGQRYYVEALQKEGTGSDNLAVAWQLGGGTIFDGTEPIPGANLIPWYDANVPLAITNPPASQTIVQSRPVTFSVGVTGVPYYTGAQWYRNGQLIAGAGGLSYTIAHVALADQLASYYVVVSNLAYSLQSSPAVLTVVTDTVPPQITLVTTAVGLTVQVAYNEFMDPASATNIANYAIAGITFTNAILNADGTTVTLGLIGTLPANFQIAVSNVKDYAGNTISPSPTVVPGYTTGLAPGMISYWPMDVVQGTKTPDIISGYDLTLQNMTATNLVSGRWSNSLSFFNAAKSLLVRSFTTNEALPIYKYTNFTVSIWINGPIQTDARIYAESSTLGNNNPMFSLGTDSTGATGNFDSFVRNNSNTQNGHKLHGIALDNTWHHVCFVMQSNSTPQAVVYVDGVLSGVNPSPIWPLTVNNLTIGAIVRASAAAWFTGQIDDVAVWNRTLAPDEVAFLFNKGTPVPPPKPLPLTINSFAADLPAVAQGDSVTLRWDVTKDATSVELQPGGDVTAFTSIGVGSFSVAPTYTTTYKLIVRRNSESVTNTATVSVIGGVSSGWTLLDNFDRYSVGTLPKPWAFAGSTAVVDVNGNRMLRAGGGVDSLSSLPLANANAMIVEGQQRTLFTRFWISQVPTAGTLFEILGLSDRGIRFWSDFNPDMGPDIILQNPSGDVQIGTRNGYLAPIELSSFTLQPQTAYNVWIDVRNDDISSGDLVSIYIAQEGIASRTLLFQDYRSDRNPNDTGILGPTGPNLAYFQAGGNTVNDLVYFDDVYLSKSDYNSTVPRPFGFTTPLTPAPITLGVSASGGQITVNYASGTLLSATNVAGPWSQVSGANPPSYTAPITGAQLYFRAQQ